MSFESRVLSLVDPIGGIDSAMFVCGTLFVMGDASVLPAAVAHTETVLAKDGITGVVVSRITWEEYALDFVA